jgi:hypothetical protein
LAEPFLNAKEIKLKKAFSKSKKRKKMLFKNEGGRLIFYLKSLF